VTIPPLPSTSRDSARDAAWLGSAGPETLQATVEQLRARVARLELENAALAYAAWSFGALADRLNAALRASRETPEVEPRD
jgi:hypothetical protein